MRDSGQRDAAVEDQLVAVSPQHLVKHAVATGLVPALAVERAAVLERLLHARVARDDRVAQELDVRRDAGSDQEHEEIAEARQPWTRIAGEPPADLGRG